MSGEEFDLTSLREAWIVDTSLEPQQEDPLLPFVFEEVLCGQGRLTDRPLIHLWRHSGALILGLRDSRLPGAVSAARQLEAEGIRVAVRNSGGAAVPLDAGVLNLSILWPKALSGSRHHEDFRAMAAWIGRLAADCTGDPELAVAVGEIPGGYCPGAYDLAVAGRKFCGLAQRRRLGAVSVQAFLILEGSGSARARLARRFYDSAAPEGSPDVPEVRPETMASLSELAGVAVTAATWKESLYRMLQPADGQVSLAYDEWLDYTREMVPVLETMKARYGLQDSERPR